MRVFFSMPSTQVSELDALKEILLRKSVRFGQFTLTSGQTSNVYIDCKPTTCDPRAMPLIGRLFLQKLEQKMWFPEAVGGLAIGAEPIAFAIARESLDRAIPISAFIVRKDRKPHGMQKIVEGIERPEGAKVVILDDVCTQGGSTAAAIQNAKSVGMTILGAACLIDREAGAVEYLRNEFGCELESIFRLSDLQRK
jgi:orotate phosphoribosyltransferase